MPRYPKLMRRVKGSRAWQSHIDFRTTVSDADFRATAPTTVHTSGTVADVPSQRVGTLAAVALGWRVIR
jgi:hypothetical protein